MPKKLFSKAFTLPLVCHPDSLAPAVRRIKTRAVRNLQGDLALRFRLSGDLGRLQVPPITCVKRADGLWQHTCFEAFVAFSGRTDYLEFNFSPSGQWAAYAFSDYRQRAQTLDPAGAPKIRIDRNTGGLTLEALLSADALPLAMRWQPLYLGLSAVVEDREGRLSYWALRHLAGTPTPKADFHQRATFNLVLPAPKILR